MRAGSLCLLLAIGVLILQIAPYIVFGFSSQLPPPINSVPDLIDITIYMPFMAIIFYMVYSDVLSGAPKPVKLVYAFSYAIFFEGHGFHWAANSIDVSLNGLDWIPYYLDEVLSHKMMFSGLFLLIAIAGLSEISGNRYEKPMLPILSGIVMGFSEALMFIEGQSAAEFLAANLAYITLYIVVAHRVGGKMKEKPFLTFSASTSASAVVFMVIYSAVFGGFVQPSEWF